MTTPRILAISSFVACGTVGLRAIGPALDALSCETMQIPSVVLSNHPGHTHTAGARLAPDLIEKTAHALAANGWFSGLAGILTGYLPSPEHVAAVRGAILAARSHSPGAQYLLDPILGDDPKGLYIDKAAADAIANDLMGLADIITPNRFELAWLSRRPVASINDAVAAAHTLAVPAVVATSIPADEGVLATVLVTREQTVAVTLAQRPNVPHGTGDLLSGLLAGHLAHGADLQSALNAAHRTLSAIIALSCGQDRLDLSPLTCSVNLT